MYPTKIGFGSKTSSHSAASAVVVSESDPSALDEPDELDELDELELIEMILYDYLLHF